MSAVDLELQTVGTVVVARLGGEIDMSNVGMLRQRLLHEVTNDVMGIVVDMRETSYIDSAGINVLFDLNRRLSERGQGLRLVVADDSPATAALRYAGVLDAFTPSPSTESAVAEFSGG